MEINVVVGPRLAVTQILERDKRSVLKFFAGGVAHYLLTLFKKPPWKNCFVHTVNTETFPLIDKT